MISPLYILVRLNEVLLCENPNSIIIYFHQLLEKAILVEIDEHILCDIQL